MLDTCVILNGPPNSGKDTLADELVEFGFHKHQFKDQLYIDTATYFDLPLPQLIYLATDRLLKERPNINLILDGEPISPRQALIHTSENYIKPYFGKDYFGLAAAEACLKQASYLAVFSDGGFVTELPALNEVFRNVVIIRLHKEGTDFGNDSRDYLKGFPNTHDIQILDGHIYHTVRTILDILDPYLPQIPQDKAISKFG